MKFLQQLFTFYINSSIHVSLAVCALVDITLMYCNYKADADLLLFVFFATITGYNFTKYAPIARLYHRTLTPSLRLIQVFSLGCFVAMCYFGIQLSQRVVLWVIPFLLLTLGYVIPFFSGTKTLRTLPGFKILVIAFCWVGVTVLLPMIHLQIMWSWDLLLIALQRLFFVIALTIPFEIRDLHYDSPALKTLPQWVGIQKSKYIGVFLLIVSYGLFFVQTGVGIAAIITKAVVILVTSLVVLKTKEKQARYFCAFWVEGIPIFWWGIVVFFYRLF